MKKLMTVMSLLLALVLVFPVLVLAQTPIVDNSTNDSNNDNSTNDSNNDNSEDNDLNISDNQTIVISCIQEQKNEPDNDQDQDQDQDQEGENETEDLESEVELKDVVIEGDNAIDESALVEQAIDQAQAQDGTQTSDQGTTQTQTNCTINIYHQSPVNQAVVQPTPVVVTNTVIERINTVRTVSVPSSAPETGGL